MYQNAILHIRVYLHKLPIIPAFDVIGVVVDLCLVTGELLITVGRDTSIASHSTFSWGVNGSRGEAADGSWNYLYCTSPRYQLTPSWDISSVNMPSFRKSTATPLPLRVSASWKSRTVFRASRLTDRTDTRWKATFAASSSIRARSEPSVSWLAGAKSE